MLSQLAERAASSLPGTEAQCSWAGISWVGCGVCMYEGKGYPILADS